MAEIEILPGNAFWYNLLGWVSYELAVILTAPSSESHCLITVLKHFSDSPSCKETGAIFTSTGSGKKVIYFSEQHFFLFFNLRGVHKHSMESEQFRLNRHITQKYKKVAGKNTTL